jgi:hypothetical protein
VTRITQYLDTKVVHDHLERMAAAGIEMESRDIAVAAGGRSG